MDGPWLSVLMPTYNGEAFLPQTLESMAGQDPSAFELIAVDDGSTDRTLDILKAYRNRLRLRIVPRDHRGNWVANTNVALELAAGRYACLLHQDDLWLPGRIETLRRWATDSGDGVFLVHATRYVDSRGRPLGLFWPALPPGRLRSGSHEVVGRLLIQNFIGCPATLFRKDVAESLGAMDEDLWYTADWDLWLKLAGQGETICLRNALSAYRVHSRSLTSQSLPKLAEWRRQQDVVLDRHFAPWSRRARPHEAESVLRAARFSLELNAVLAAASGGQSVSLLPALQQGLGLGSSGWVQYLSNCRIADRISARLRARLWASRIGGRDSVS